MEPHRENNVSIGDFIQQRGTHMKKLITFALAACMAATSALALTPAQLDVILAERYPGSVPAAVTQAATVEDKLTALGDPFAQYYTAQEFAAFQEAMDEAGQETGSTVAAALEDGHVGRIAISAFGPGTYDALKNAVTANSAADRWVVDLRGNTGGELKAAVNAMSVFVGKGNLIYLRGKEGNLAAARAENAKITGEPVIVLVNSRTASAAELFAANIRDRQAGIIIGSRTYGKGVAQSALTKAEYPEAFADGSALILTTDYVFSDSLSTNNVMGVIPTLLVEDEMVEPVAKLLCASAPKGNNSGYLRVHLGHWRWYVELNRAQSQPEVFAALLEALPPQTDLYLGSEQDWNQRSVDFIAAQFCKGYTPRSFPDAADSRYSNAINTLKTYGIVKGNGAGAFEPSATLDRASLCALLAQAMSYPQSTAAPAFADTPADAWYTPYVTTLSQMGIVNGYDDGLFHPNDPIPHQQFMVILSRIIANTNHTCHAALAAGMSEEDAASGEYDAYDPWARTGVWALDGWWHAPAKDIDPKAPTTREEAAYDLYAALNGLGLLPQ